MSFDLSKIKFEPDDIFSNGKDPVVCESASEAVNYYSYPATSPAELSPVGVPIYNTDGGKNVNFYVNIGDTEQFLPNESYIEIRGYSSDISENDPDPNFYGKALNGSKCGIVPFPTSFIRNASIRLNRSTQMLEQLDNSAGEALFFKILTNFTKEGVESSGDLFFLPAIANSKAARDTSSPEDGLAGVSTTRVNLNLKKSVTVEGEVVQRIVKWSKIIPLSLLFSSMASDIAMFTTALEIDLTFYGYENDWRKYHYKTSAIDAGTPRTFITDCRLVLSTSRLTESGTKTLRNDLIKNNITTQFAYDYYSIVRRSANGGLNSITESNKRNLQARIIGCNSIDDVDGKGINNTQYSGNKITNVLFSYGNAQVPKQGSLTIDVANPKANGQLYSLYRILHNKMKSDKLVEYSLPIDFNYNFANEKTSDPNAIDLRNQFLLCCPFFLNGVEGNHRNISGNDLRIDINNDSAEKSSYTICMITKHYVQITSDLSTYVID